MNYSIFKKLAILAAGTILTLAAGENKPAQALLFNYSLSGNNLSGNFSYDSSAAANQYVTVPEGLNISLVYNGQTYTQADDSLAAVLTDSLGQVDTSQGLGLQFVTSTFTINGGNFVNLIDTTGNSDQTLTSTAVPFDFSSSLGASLFVSFVVGNRIINRVQTSRKKVKL